MRRKQQIQALQQELALLRQTVDSGKELAALGAAAVHCRVYRVIVAQEVKKALKPVNARLDALQATVDAVAEAEGVAPEKAHKSKKHSR